MEIGIPREDVVISICDPHKEKVNLGGRRAETLCPASFIHMNSLSYTNIRSSTFNFI
jgi:hypothetical protein